MSDEYPIQFEEDARSGRYFISLPDQTEAEMTFRKLGGDVIAIDHTFVPPQFRGASLASKLVERGIADARQNGLKVKPVCSYVVAQFRRHPDWSDLLA